MNSSSSLRGGGGGDVSVASSSGAAETNNNSFFTSNQHATSYPTASTSTTAAAAQPRSTQVFLPPLPPTRSISTGGGDLGVGGATLLSDEETNASDSPAASTSYITPVVAAAGTRPRTARQSSVASSVDTVSGQKGKGKAKDGAKKKATGGGGGGVKRKQQIGPDGKPLPKKKKAGRACAACQKAHLTCDDGTFLPAPLSCHRIRNADSCLSTARPCARCVKKGCPEECVDGARKKAKYLQEIPDEREQDFLSIIA